MFSRIMLALSLVLGLITAASAAPGPKEIYTGGPKGAYWNLFCPPIPAALSKLYFKGYSCVQSQGTVDNMNRVVANPEGFGIGQSDVFFRLKASDPKYANLQVIRTLACEGVFMVTKNDRLDYGTIQGLARRIPFVIAGGPESGNAATFKALMAADPDGLGKARNIRYEADLFKRLQPEEVGFFIQFADPDNANIKALVEGGWRVIPVVSGEVIGTKVGGRDVFNVQSFAITSGFFSKKSVTTACTPAVLFGASPASFTDPGAREDQTDKVNKLGSMPDSDFLPAESPLGKILAGASKLGGKALDEAVAAAKLAKKKAQEALAD